jgi:hypothetical protein
MKKAQSAMEYLMTYGWAILIVIIVAAALYALGIFNPQTYTTPTASGFQSGGFQVETGGWQASASQCVLVLKNIAGNKNITSIVATYAGSSTSTMSPTYDVMASNDETTFTLGGWTGPTSGTSYSVDVDITYDNLDSGLTGFKVENAKLTGTAI